MTDYPVTRKQIDEIINQIIENPGPRFPGMTYEQGVRNALDWVLGDEEENPLIG